MTDNTCSYCHNDCTSGVGLTTHYRALDKNGEPKGEWLRQRLCTRCAVWLGELGDARARAADEQAERAGV